jgi:hypothetical protein
MPTERKQREKRNFELIKSGNISDASFQRLPKDFLEQQTARDQERPLCTI